MKAQYSTYIKFRSGDSIKEDTHSDKLKSTIQRLMKGPAKEADIVEEFKVVSNTTDETLLHVIDGIVVFPN